MSPSVDFRDYLQTDEEALGGKILTIKCNFIALEILESDMFYTSFGYFQSKKKFWILHFLEKKLDH